MVVFDVISLMALGLSLAMAALAVAVARKLTGPSIATRSARTNQSRTARECPSTIPRHHLMAHTARLLLHGALTWWGTHPCDTQIDANRIHGPPHNGRYWSGET